MNIKNVIVGLLLLAMGSIYAANKNNYDDSVVVSDYPVARIVTKFFPDGKRIMWCFNKLNGKSSIVHDNDNILNLGEMTIVPDADWTKNLRAEEEEQKKNKGNHNKTS